MKAYFENIEFEIKSEILKAQDSISIAVSWINNEVLFESIRSKLGTTKIKLLFENDSNNKKGGLKGSHPYWGRYISFRQPNWATKFFIDAILMEQETYNLVEA